MQTHRNTGFMSVATILRSSYTRTCTQVRTYIHQFQAHTHIRTCLHCLRSKVPASEHRHAAWPNEAARPRHRPLPLPHFHSHSRCHWPALCCHHLQTPHLDHCMCQCTYVCMCVCVRCTYLFPCVCACACQS